MKLVTSAALAPVVTGAPIVIAGYLLRDFSSGMFAIAAIIGSGAPVVIVFSVLATWFLQSDELFQSRHTLLYCALFGAGFAAVATLGFLGLGGLFWAVVAWGFLSGAAFRLLLGERTRQPGSDTDQGSGPKLP